MPQARDSSLGVDGDTGRNRLWLRLIDELAMSLSTADAWVASWRWAAAPTPGLDADWDQAFEWIKDGHTHHRHP